MIGTDVSSSFRNKQFIAIQIIIFLFKKSDCKRVFTLLVWQVRVQQSEIPPVQ